MGAMLLGTSSLLAQDNTAFTKPSGYTTVSVAPAPAEGQSTLTAFSVTLRNSVVEAGKSTSIGSTTLSNSAANWSDGEWTSEPHLIYITNANGGEEAFLIKSHTASELTLDTTGLDLTTRFGTGIREFSILKAHTFGSLFGTDSVPFQTGDENTADLLYVWNGGWTTYFHNGSNWERTDSFQSADNDVLFPDEGIFVQRRGTTELNLTFLGNVPYKPQVSTIPGQSLTAIGSRYPVGTTVRQMGLQNLPGWQSGSETSGDRFFVWNNPGWVTYFYNGSNWEKSSSFGNVDNEIIPGDSMIFVLRVSSSTQENSDNTHELPYTVE